jgi:hypothetical protein
MDKVRHHKFPDTTLEPHQYGDSGINNGNINEFANGPFGPGKSKTISMGFEAINVKPPQEYAHLIQGFKIVQADQKIKDKTVIDKGIAYYNHFSFKMFHGRDLPSGPFFGACTWMQQGKYFNKHISSFACAHGGYREINIAGFGDTPEVSLFGSGDDGQTSIAGHSVYDLTFGSGGILPGSGHPISSGFVSSYGIGGGVGNPRSRKIKTKAKYGYTPDYTSLVTGRKGKATTAQFGGKFAGFEARPITTAWVSKLGIGGSLFKRRKKKKK